MRVLKFLLKKEHLHPLLKRLSEETGTRKDFRIPHVDSYVLHVSLEDVVTLKVEAADFIIYNPTKISQFDAVWIYKAARLFLTALGEIYIRHSSVERASLKFFMVVKL